MSNNRHINRTDIGKQYRALGKIKYDMMTKNQFLNYYESWKKNNPEKLNREIKFSEWYNKRMGIK